MAQSSLRIYNTTQNALFGSALSIMHKIATGKALLPSADGTCAVIKKDTIIPKGTVFYPSIGGLSDECLSELENCNFEIKDKNGQIHIYKLVTLTDSEGNKSQLFYQTVEFDSRVSNHNETENVPTPLSVEYIDNGNFAIKSPHKKTFEIWSECDGYAYREYEIQDGISIERNGIKTTTRRAYSRIDKQSITYESYFYETEQGKKYFVPKLNDMGMMSNPTQFEECSQEEYEQRFFGFQFKEELNANAAYASMQPAPIESREPGFADLATISSRIIKTENENYIIEKTLGNGQIIIVPVEIKKTSPINEVGQQVGQANDAGLPAIQERPIYIHRKGKKGFYIKEFKGEIDARRIVRVATTAPCQISRNLGVRSVAMPIYNQAGNIITFNRSNIDIPNILMPSPEQMEFFEFGKDKTLSSLFQTDEMKKALQDYYKDEEERKKFLASLDDSKKNIYASILKGQIPGNTEGTMINLSEILAKAFSKIISYYCKQANGGVLFAHQKEFLGFFVAASSAFSTLDKGFKKSFESALQQNKTSSFFKKSEELAQDVLINTNKKGRRNKPSQANQTVGSGNSQTN